MTVPDASNPMLDAALAFHAAGCSVVAARPGKRPISYWEQYQHHPATEDQIHTWFDGGHPGLGVVCGEASGNLIMLELEPELMDRLVQVIQGFMSAGLSDLWRRISTGYMERSAGGGVHWLYRIGDLPNGQPCPGNQKLARRPGAAPGTIEVLAETRGSGGFTVTWPSHGPIHPDGGSWTLIKGSPAEIPTITFAEHDGLCTVLRSFDEMPTEEDRWQSTSSSAVTAGTSIPPATTTGAAVAPSASSGDLRPGDDFEQRATWDEILTPLGWVHVKTVGSVRHWRRPGKTGHDDTSATTGFGDKGDYFHLFSTSVDAPVERSIGKYPTYTWLHHGGDFTAAARELRRQGYGGQNGASSSSGSVFDLLPPQPAPEAPWQPSASADTNGGSASDGGSGSASGTSAGTAVESSGDASPGADAEPHTSWWPRDLTDIIAGRGNTEREPAILARDDGHRILYAGKVNGLVGESESGKSWIALLAVKQTLEVGGGVLYYDFEDTAEGLIGRLQSMGLTPQRLAGFHYVSPEEALHDFAQADVRATLAALTPVLIVVDGFNAAMTLLSLSLSDNTDITKFFLTFLRPLRAGDACVLTVDHVTKNKESRGDYAIGGQAKKAMTDGSYINVENVQPFGRNQNGKLRLTSIKDRPGHVRAISQGAKNIGTVDFQSSNDTVRLRIQTPDLRSKEERGPFMPTFLMEKVSLLLEGLADGEASTKAICEGVAGRDGHIRAALDRLVEQHYATRSVGPRGAVLHRSTRPYRKPHDDPSDLLAPENEEEP